MDRPVSVHEMESVAVGLEGPDFTKEVGLDMGGPNDSLGFGMLANPGRQRSQQENTFTMPSEPSSMGGLAEVEIGTLDTMEPITLNLGGGGSNFSNSAPIEIQFSKAEDEKSGGGGLFSNMQTSSAPGFHQPLRPAWTPRERRRRSPRFFPSCSAWSKRGSR